MKRLFALVLCLALPLAAESPRNTASRLRNDAQLTPDDDAALQAFWDSLPKSGNYAVVEGDLLLTKEELRSWLRRDRTIRRSRPAIGPELLVNLRDDGGLDYYETMAERVLTYSIDTSTFSPAELSEVRTKLADAATQWEAICPECGIDFVEKSEGPVWFVVEGIRNQPYIAAAFFPHYPQARRVLRIDSSWFPIRPEELRTGVLRHELGHVLGYRHEHIRNVPGCYSEGGRWKALTEYDKSSVMHYFCGGGGSAVLALSEKDKAAHKGLYAPPGAAAFALPRPGAELAEQRWDAAVAEAAAVEAMTRTERDSAPRPAFAALLASLPKSGNRRVLDGDIRVTDSTLRELLRAVAVSPRPLTAGPELIVNLHGGERDWYSDPAKRTLRYRVDRASFSTDDRYQRAIRWMRIAGLAWQRICQDCGIEFVHASVLDARPDAEVPPADFVVEQVDEGSYLASAFFPHEAQAFRRLSIDASLLDFDAGDAAATEQFQAGVIKHELGHVLGYRHEHTRGVPGCYYEDSDWEALTPYDRGSVMHYPCGGGGNPAGPEITAVDIEGHRALYGQEKQQAADTAAPSSLVVRLQGDGVSQNAARVLRELRKANLLRLEEHIVVPGDAIESIYEEALGVRGQSALMTRLAESVNGRKLNDLMPGETVLVPALKFAPFPFTRSLSIETPEDLQRAEELKSRWNYIHTAQTGVSWGTAEPTFVSLTFTGFEVAVESADPRRIEQVADRLRDLAPANILVSTPSPAPAGFNAFEQWAHALSNPKLPVGEEHEIDLSALIRQPASQVNDLCGVPRTAPPWRSVTAPEVVLVDQKVYLHPDLNGAVTGETIAPLPEPIVDGTYQWMRPVPFNRTDHGTHMAGIIAARANGFGIRGIDPSATISSIVWNDADDQNERRVANAIYSAINGSTTAQIFVFALSWKHVPAPKNDLQRYRTSLLSRVIFENDAPLFVVAAGNDDAEITTLSDTGPMNLGDEENVLVVTACESCFDDGRLIRDANRSPQEHLVHVAGPGVAVPSTTFGSNYSEAGGTSPAAAFAGGLASAMVRRWPFPAGPPAIKRRLMLTSRPSLGPEAAGGLAFGVLDAEAALLDPALHWLQRNGESVHIEAPSVHWTRNEVAFHDLLTGHERSFRARDVVRIVRAGADPSGNQTVWVVYYNDPDDPTVLRRSRRLVSPSLATRLLSVGYACDGEPKRLELALKDLDDLLLARAVGLERQ